MIRMTVTLIVAIYIVLIVVPGEDHGAQVEVTRSEGQNWLVAIISDAQAGAQRPPRVAPPDASRTLRHELTDDLLETDDGYALERADGELLEITAVIDPVDLMPDDGSSAVAAVSVVDPGAVEIAQAQARAERVIWRVTGNNVNFRAGPSTNTAVLAGLVRGDEVEFLADAPDGWAHLRVLSSGLEGYMAARFLEPVN
ncbi:SH3 domain-containing protein [Gymnodinialimonas hymeniacidonis]|uniref:SH3 domain-containing protein n=1 Tax=Gymnodinialimonas hymeniacidonis TaxID=3126508 RepID=UPI0034C6080D